MSINSEHPFGACQKVLRNKDKFASDLKVWLSELIVNKTNIESIIKILFNFPEFPERFTDGKK